MSGIHYFQRYHGKENVHTANAFLLINRLYQYKPRYFYEFLDNLVEGEMSEYDFRVNMTLQAKSTTDRDSTVPDAMIMQNGYRLCVEAKLGDWFDIRQIEGHLKAFSALDTKYKIFLSLSNCSQCGIAQDIIKRTEDFNKIHQLYNEERLIYRHLTFENLVGIIEALLTDRDYEFSEILEDYKAYCLEQGLIDTRYQLMKVYATGATFDINMKLNLYYRKSTDSIKAELLGLYIGKKVAAIGRIIKTVRALMPRITAITLRQSNITSSSPIVSTHAVSQRPQKADFSAESCFPLNRITA